MPTTKNQPAVILPEDVLSELSDNERELVISLGSGVNGRLSQQGEGNLASGQDLRQIKSRMKRRWRLWVDQHFVYSLPVANGLIHIADWRDKYPEVLEKLPDAVRLAVLNWALPNSVRVKVAEMVLAGEIVTYEVFQAVKGDGKVTPKKNTVGSIAPAHELASYGEQEDDAKRLATHAAEGERGEESTEARDVVVDRYTGWQSGTASERAVTKTIKKRAMDQAVTAKEPEGIDAQTTLGAAAEPTANHADTVDAGMEAPDADPSIPEQIASTSAHLRDLAARLYESLGYRYEEVRPALLPVVELVNFLGILKKNAQGAAKAVTSV